MPTGRLPQTRETLGVNMASLTDLNEILIKAASDLESAMKVAASSKEVFAAPVLRRLSAAQVEIFEAQYHLWALEPNLLPDVLKGPAEDPDRAFEVAMERAHRAMQAGIPEVARGVLDIFIAYQTSLEHLERARKERAQLSK